jgi:hypothetical protein
MADYSITNEAVKGSELSQLPESVRQELIKIHDKIINAKSLRSSVKKLEALAKQFPDSKLISNFLGNAYKSTQNPKLKSFVCDNYKKYPDYLFARIEYAELCIDSGEPEKVLEIFKDGFDLGLLYPERSAFHISEFLALSSVVCRYFFVTKQHEKANLLFREMKNVAPNHSVTLATEQRFISPVEAKDVLNTMLQELFQKPKKSKFLA